MNEVDYMSVMLNCIHL